MTPRSTGARRPRGEPSGSTALTCYDLSHPAPAEPRLRRVRSARPPTRAAPPTVHATAAAPCRVRAMSSRQSAASAPAHPDRRPAPARPARSGPGRCRARRGPRQRRGDRVRPTSRSRIDRHARAHRRGHRRPRHACTLRGSAACSRCLQPVEGAIDVHVDELFEPHPARGRDLPARRGRRSTSSRSCATPCCSSCRCAPLCRDDCAGLCPTCGADRNADRVRLRSRRARPPLGGPAVARALNLTRSLRWPSRSAR